MEVKAEVESENKLAGSMLKKAIDLKNNKKKSKASTTSCTTYIY